MFTEEGECVDGKKGEKKTKITTRINGSDRKARYSPGQRKLIKRRI